MKTRQNILLVLLVIIILVFTVAALTDNKSALATKMVKSVGDLNTKTSKNAVTVDKHDVLKTVAQTKTKRVVVFEGMTIAELGNKLNKSMTGLLSGQGHYFAARSIELGINPYMALAISLHETGCEWTCSRLARACYNIGGQKGSPGCDGGSYRRFNSLKEGIDGFLYNLHGNYIRRGLTTPERINPVYAENPLWHQKVRFYMGKIAAR